MKARPTRATKDGKLYLALRKQALADKRLPAEYLQLHALEAFLERLMASPRASDFVLKGGVLLAAYNVRRPTSDVDLVATQLSNDVEVVQEAIASIASQPVDDGWTLTVVDAETIREDAEYQGVRVNMAASLATAKETFHVDVSFGDPIEPSPAPVALARVLGGSIQVRGYPLCMVFAEKLVTAIQKGNGNTRWRDYVDVYSLSLVHAVDGTELDASLRAVARSRGTQLVTLTQAVPGYALVAQTKWAQWLRKQALHTRLPASFADVLQATQVFADPALSGEVVGRVWHPGARIWR